MSIVQTPGLAQAGRRRQPIRPPHHVVRVPAPVRESWAEAEGVPVVVMADDPISGQGAVAYLRSRREVRLLEADAVAEAEVVLILAENVTDETFESIARVEEPLPGGRARFVLVGDGIREQHVVRAAFHGAVSLVARRTADFDQVLDAVVDLRAGRVRMPAEAVGWLAGRLRAIEQDVLKPNGLNIAGLERREIDVLRMLAEGLDTVEIGQRLKFSERTVKNTIYAVTRRFNLHSRAHAVAFALRSGVL